MPSGAARVGKIRALCALGRGRAVRGHGDEEPRLARAHATTARKDAGGAWPALARCAARSPTIANRTAPGERRRLVEGIDRDRAEVIANAMRKLALEGQRGPFVLRVMSGDFAINGASTSAPGLVTPSRQHSTANCRPTSTPLFACGEKRSVPPHGRGEIRAPGPAPTSEDTENRDTRYAAPRLHRQRDSPSPVSTGT